MNEITPENRILLEKFLTPDNIKRLLAYAHCKVKRLSWRGVRSGNVPGGLEAEDFVNEALLYLLNARRSWDSQKNPDLYQHLKGIIDSLISHRVQSKENQSLVSASYCQDSVSQHKNIETILETGKDEISSQYAQLEENECYEFLWGLVDFVKDDPLLKKMVEAIIEGCEDRSDIAKYCRVNAKEITNARKRLQRRFEEYVSKVGYNPFDPFGGRR